MTGVVSWINNENNMAYEEILLKLNEIIQLLVNSESSFSVGDYIAIGVAVLSIKNSSTYCKDKNDVLKCDCKNSL